MAFCWVFHPNLLNEPRPAPPAEPHEAGLFFIRDRHRWRTALPRPALDHLDPPQFLSDPGGGRAVSATRDLVAKEHMRNHEGQELAFAIEYSKGKHSMEEILQVLLDQLLEGVGRWAGPVTG